MSALMCVRTSRLQRSFALTLHLTVAEAIDGVVVDHAGGLHEGVADGGADELEAAPL